MSVFVKTSLIAALAFSAAAPAFAEPVFETHTLAVSTAGLDLTTQQGVASLQKRIHQAAISVCGEAAGNDLDVLISIHKCRVNAIEGAQSQLRHAVQTAQTSHVTRVSLR